MALYIHKTLSFRQSETEVQSRVHKGSRVSKQKITTAAGVSGLIAVIYRPPNGGSMDESFDVLQEKMRSFDNAVIMGDLKAHFKTHNNCAASIGNNFLQRRRVGSILCSIVD